MTTERKVKLNPGEVIRLNDNEEVRFDDKHVIVMTRHIKPSWYQKISESIFTRKMIKQEVTFDIGMTRKTAKILTRASKSALKKAAKVTRDEAIK